MPKLAAYTFLARYALIILATRMASGGWLPPGLADDMAADPAVIETVSGLLVGAGALVWYYWSAAREAVGRFLD